MTGAGRGLGRAHALALADAGAAVLACDVAGAAEVAAEIERAGGTAAAFERSLGSVADGRALVAHAVEERGRVDVVVNNAGISVRGNIEDLDDDAIDDHLGVHLLATIGTTAAAFPVMRAQGGGRIINTVSGHAFDPKAPGSAAYATAKGGVFGFTRAAALEGAPHGIAVNAVAPLAYTPMSEAYLANVEGAAERLAPEHVAAVVLWLAAEAPPSLTGRVVRVEGELVGEYRVELTELVPRSHIEEVLA